MTISLTDTLPNRLNPAGDPLTFGSTAGADTNDPTRLARAAANGNYVYVPSGNLNYLTVSSPFAGALSWTTRVVGKVRCSVAAASSGRPLTIGYQGILNRSPSGWSLTYRTTGNGFAGTSTFANPHAAYGDIEDAGFEITPTTVTVYARSAAGMAPLEDQDVGDWTGWTVLGTLTPGNLAVATDLNATLLGSNVGNSWIEGGIWSAVMAIDNDVRLFNPNTDPTLTGWIIYRAATGLKTAVVTRPVILPDGTDDYGQLPADATPTFTATTGKQTVAVLFRQHVNAPFTQRLWSSESITNNGLLLYLNTGGTEVRAAAGGSITAVNTGGGPTGTLGTMRVAAAVVDNGTLSVYGNLAGLASPVSITGVGTITHDSPRMASRADSAANLFDGEILSVIQANGQALTGPQLDALAARLIAGDYA